MHSSGSILLTIVERIRAYLDEATLDAKFTNDYIVRHVIGPEMVNVMSRLSNNYDNPIRIRHEITLVKEQQYYVLPPNIGEIYRFAIMDDSGRINQEFLPRNEFHPRGPGWSIEGNELSIRPFPSSAETADIHYIPNGDFLPHYSTSTGQLVTTTTFKFSGTPTLGGIDNRENSYAGAILRVWADETGTLEERVVSSYDASTATCTVRRPFSFTPAVTMKYEVAPIGMQSMAQAISASGAMNLGTARNITVKQMQFIQLQYKMAMKTIGDNFSSMQNRKPKSFEKNTIDNHSSFILGG